MSACVCLCVWGGGCAYHMMLGSLLLDTGWGRLTPADTGGLDIKHHVCFDN